MRKPRDREVCLTLVHSQQNLTREYKFHFADLSVKKTEKTFTVRSLFSSFRFSFFATWDDIRTRSSILIKRLPRASASRPWKTTWYCRKDTKLDPRIRRSRHFRSLCLCFLIYTTIGQRRLFPSNMKSLLLFFSC